MQQERNQHVFSVFHNQHQREEGMMGAGGSNPDSCRCTVLNLELNRCDCGEWQEYGIPCVHAVAYFKAHEGMSFEQVVAKVDGRYTYEMEKELLQENLIGSFRTGSVGPPTRMRY
jgi:hypothetical protein